MKQQKTITLPMAEHEELKVLTSEKIEQLRERFIEFKENIKKKKYTREDLGF